MIRRKNCEIDVVSTGTFIMIIGLLFILMAPLLSDFSYAPKETANYEDKTTRIPDYVSPFGFIVIGFLLIIIGVAVFLKNFVNLKIDAFIDMRNKMS